ncbi:MAG: hypothetical protein VX733_10640 [Candidatus Latescibacterota bacterium]|nr:hypothetical protein [Candidatus Latescibacterota bacterium]
MSGGTPTWRHGGEPSGERSSSMQQVVYAVEQSRPTVWNGGISGYVFGALVLVHPPEILTGQQFRGRQIAQGRRWREC